MESVAVLPDRTGDLLAAPAAITSDELSHPAMRPAVTRRGFALDQQAPQDLPGRRLWNLIDDFDRTHFLLQRHSRADVGDDLFRCELPSEHDERFGTSPASSFGSGTTAASAT